ncbi:MAG: DUF4870 family protein [Burkholderiaceae bacterium]
MNNEVIDVPAKSAGELAALRQMTLISYLLNAAGFLLGVTWFVAVVLCYIKRDDARGTLYESHLTWQIRTFWWGLVWALAGSATLLLGVGFAVLGIVYLWVIYRVVKGFIYWSDEKPMKA